MRGLAEMFNVNYFICSQTNPHIIPALNIKRHLNRTFADMAEQEFKHRCATALPWHPRCTSHVAYMHHSGGSEPALAHVCWPISLLGRG